MRLGFDPGALLETWEQLDEMARDVAEDVDVDVPSCVLRDLIDIGRCAVSLLEDKPSSAANLYRAVRDAARSAGDAS